MKANTCWADLALWLPCLSASECIETKALMAGYVMLLTEANTPAAHIILQAT